MPTSNRPKIGNRMLRQIPLHLMVLPAFILVLIFSYGPIAGVVIAFQKYNVVRGIAGSEWVGFDNFVYLFHLPDTLSAVRNTVYIATMKIVAGLVVPIVVSLLLNEVRKEVFKRSIQTMIYLPHFLSWIILGGIMIDILSPSMGIVNQLLGFLRIEPVFFLGSNHWFPITMVVSDVWKEFGFSTIVYLAALTAIHPALYESAAIDGANRWKMTLHITLPGMLPVIILLGTLSLGNVLNAGFDQIFNLYSPQVYDSGDILDTFVYRLGIEQARYSIATAVGLFKSAVSIVLISISYYLAYKLANYRIF